MTQKTLTQSGVFMALFLILVLPIKSFAQSSSSKPLIVQPIDDTSRIILRGNTHPLARAEFDQGVAQSSLPMQRMLLVLRRDPAQEAALQHLLDQQQDNSSGNYHHWLTPQQFGAQFGPAEQDIQGIATWLRSHGFQVDGASPGGVVIEFSGTAGQVQETFHTTIHKYLINGAERYANATDPELPVALSGSVAGIRSLYNFPATPMNIGAGVFRRDKKSGKTMPVAPLPIHQFTPGGGFQCGALDSVPCESLGPFDLATIYNVTPLLSGNAPIDGTGQTIAIVGETDINPNDWTGFWNMFGVATPKGTLNIIHNGADPGVQGDESEADIDTQWSSAVAPGATIDYVVSQTTEATLGVDLSAEYIVDNNLASVMSESYGVCELFIGTTGNAFYNALWQQASAQGITVFVSSGDQGSAVCDRGANNAHFGLAVNGFGSTPYNVAVGGTDFNDVTNNSTYWNPTNAANGSNAKGYIPEMTWNDSCTNSELFNFLGATTAEQSCNNPDIQEDDLAGVAGGSGGASNCIASTSNTQASCAGGYAKPSWQNAPGVPNDNKRDVPDVSLFASNGFNGSFYIVCESDVTGPCGLNENAFLGFGGTSVASPAFAGIMALINQKTGERQGNANYVLYKMATTASNTCSSNSVPTTGTNSCIFYDTPSGSTIAMPCVTNSPNCSTSTAGDKNGVLTGFATTAGFDLATGLGSVNVENLVNQWSTYAGQFKASKVSTFTLGPPTTITHGQPIPVSASVVPQSGAGTPTGTVVLIANNGLSPSNHQVAPQLFPLANGATASGASATFLPGGTDYSVIAHYSGDSIFAPSDSSPLNVTVNPEPSKVQAQIITFDLSTGQTANSNATSFPYGTSDVLRANVTGSGGALCALNGIDQYGCPTGSVTLKDTFNGVTSAIDAGTYSLNSEGYAEDQTVSLHGGQHSIVASYSGDKSYLASSTATPDVVTVTPEPTNSSQEGKFNGPITVGSTVVFLIQTTTANPGFYDVSPTGTYTLFDGTKQIQAAVSTFDGAVFPFPNSPFVYDTIAGNLQITVAGPIGPHSFSAIYSGDSNFGSSNSGTFTVNVAYQTSTAISASALSIQTGQSVTFTASISSSQSGGPALTGSVQFQVDGGNVGSPVNVSNGQAQFITSSVPLGIHTISAGYSGDPNYAPSSANLSETVMPGPTFSVTASPSTVLIAAPGGLSTTTLTFVGENGFSGTIPLSSSLCSGLPSETTCSFNSSSVALSGGTPITTAVVTFQTTKASRALPLGKRRTGPSPLAIYVTAAVVASIFCFLSWITVYLGKRIWRATATAAAVIGLLAISSCGGGGSSSGGGGGGVTNPGTPIGPAFVMITFNGTNITPVPTVTVLIDVE
jgi:Pro-kumamolisin, activation domain/Bacterial Ig-like domain (group 3)